MIEWKIQTGAKLGKKAEVHHYRPLHVEKSVLLWIEVKLQCTCYLYMLHLELHVHCIMMPLKFGMK